LGKKIWESRKEKPSAGKADRVRDVKYKKKTKNRRAHPSDLLGRKEKNVREKSQKKKEKGERPA